MLQYKQFQGLSCPAFPSWQDLSPHIASFMCVLLKTYRHFLQGSHSSLLWERVWTTLPTTPVAEEPQLSPAWGPVTLTPTLQGCQLCPSPAQPGPTLRVTSWPGLSTSLSPGSCPCPGLGLPQLSHSLAGKLRLCPASSTGSPHCFCIPGSCWASLAHRCHNSVVGSAPASFNIIQYFMGLGPWFYSDISILAITMGRDQAAQNNINPWNSLKMFKILIWDYFLHWGGCSKSQLIGCVTKPISFLCEYISCDDNTQRNPEGQFFKSSLMKICIYLKQISVSICFKDLGENILKSTSWNRNNEI